MPPLREIPNLEEETIDVFPPAFAFMGHSTFNIRETALLWAAAVPQKIMSRTLSMGIGQQSGISHIPEDVITRIVDFAAPLAWFYQTRYAEDEKPRTMVVITGSYEATCVLFADLFLCSADPFGEDHSFTMAMHFAARYRGWICNVFDLMTGVRVVAFVDTVRPRLASLTFWSEV